MKDVYVRPQAELVSFAPNNAIAMEQPGWGWEDDVFSTPEAQSFTDDAERRMGDEG